MNSKRFSSLKNDNYIKQKDTNRELNIKPIKYSKTNLFLVIFLVMAITYIFSVNMFTFGEYVWNLPSFLGKGSLILMLCIVYLGAIKLLFAKLDSISGLLVFFGFFSVVSTLINYETQKINFIYTIIVQLLWIAVFFVIYTKTGKQLKDTTVRIILCTFPMVFFMCIFIYLKYVEVVGQGNAYLLVYYILCFLPFVLCVNKNSIKMIFLLIIFFSLLISMKRTGFIAFVVALFVSYIIDRYIMGKGRKKKVINTLVIFLTIITGIFMYNYIVDVFDLDIILRLQQLSTDLGSGRNIIYRSVWHYQLNSTVAEWLIGRGYNGVSNTSAAGLENLFFRFSAAHNDFLEILYDYGIIGLSIYLLFCLKLIKHSIKLIRLKSDMAGPFAASLVIFFILSMFSILILYPEYYLYLVLFWAMCFAEDYKVSKNY